jgi:hypothetical protein
MRMAHPIYPHGELAALADNLWQVQGSLKLPVPRNMTVLRASTGQLVLYSVVALHEAGMRSLEALGEPAVVVIPHRRHQMDAPFYKARYPRIRVLAPDPARVRGVSVDGGLDELSAFDVRSYVLPGNTYEDVVMDVPLAGGGGRALCVCETLGNVSMPGAWSLIFRVLGPPGGGFGIARAVRLREIRGSAELRAWLGQQAERRDLRALLFGHGPALTQGIAEALRQAASQL